MFRESLTSLDNTIKCGNSLVGPNFFKGQSQSLYGEPEERERINAFDWWAEFPEVKAAGGFDIVVGNPPYVKLQNFAQVHADMAAYLRDGRSDHRYQSTTTGNFDLYLPFIERGIELLNREGRMGFIAPNLWVVNEYGEGLRQLVHRGRHLDKWIDFKGFQVFEEAITYTALQFYTKAPNDAVRVAIAADGRISDIDWNNSNLGLSYSALSPGAPWVLAKGTDKLLIDKLGSQHPSLGHPSITSHIFQGLIAGADHVFQMKRLGKNTYWCEPKEEDAYEVAIEDDIMKPLVSGPEAKRYVEPSTDTYILFPYSVAGGVAALFGRGTMTRKYPNAWKHLSSYKAFLRFREYTEAKKKRGLQPKFDDQQWYRFSRDQNLTRQNVPKLIVAQTVKEMRVCYDPAGTYYLNNVRVNGILPTGPDPWFLLAVLNGPVADFVFRRIAAPKSGGYFEANKQFIAPLPVARGTLAEEKEIGRLAQRLQKESTARMRLLDDIERRVAPSAKRRQPIEWLFPGLGRMDEWEKRAPQSLDSAQRQAYADQSRSLEIDKLLDIVETRLSKGAQLRPELHRGELRFYINDSLVISGIFVDSEVADFVVSQWQAIAHRLQGTDIGAKQLVDELRSVAMGATSTVKRQVEKLVSDLNTVSKAIANNEADINDRLFRLYKLSAAERQQVQGGSSS